MDYFLNFSKFYFCSFSLHDIISISIRETHRGLFRYTYIYRWLWWNTRLRFENFFIRYRTKLYSIICSDILIVNSFLGNIINALMVFSSPVSKEILIRRPNKSGCVWRLSSLGAFCKLFYFHRLHWRIIRVKWKSIRRSILRTKPRRTLEMYASNFYQEHRKQLCISSK